jgi:hypothetical protein
LAEKRDDAAKDLLARAFETFADGLANIAGDYIPSGKGFATKLPGKQMKGHKGRSGARK